MKMNKILVVCFLSTFCTLSLTASDEDSLLTEEFFFPIDEASAYLEKYYKVAIQEMENSKIPASITLAQGMLESDFGRSDLAQQANNHFGIKCGNDWNGGSFYKWDDDAEKSCFRKYEKTLQSFKDHSAFLKKSRYSELFSLPIDDYKGWAKGLKKAGYATSSTYPQKLIALIERYRLYDYDSATPNNPGPQVTEVPTKTPTDHNKGILFSKFGKRYTIVLPNENIDALATRTGKTTKNLVAFNELKGRSLEAGQIVWLQTKDDKYVGSQSFHKAQSGETLYDVAQTYNVKLERLAKINRLKANATLKEGQKIRLKKKESFLSRLLKKFL